MPVVSKSSNTPSANTKIKKSLSSNKNQETNNNSKETKFLMNPKIKMNLISIRSKRILIQKSKSWKVEKLTSPECPKWNSDINLSNVFKKISKKLSLQKLLTKESTENYLNNLLLKDLLKCFKKMFKLNVLKRMLLLLKNSLFNAKDNSMKAPQFKPKSA